MTDKITNIIISEELANERLDQALAKLMPDYSRTQIQHWIESGAVLVNGVAVKGKSKVKGGEHVAIEITLKQQPQWEAQKIELNIVYEDESIIVVNKPIGLVVHPGTGNSDRTLLNALIHHAPALKDLPRAGIVHRLDKDTSGLLVIAKTPHAIRHITQQLKDRSLLREYQTIVYGKMISGGTIDEPIERHPIHRKKMSVSETGKHAVTHYRVMERYRGHTRLRVKLETGRTHQIRVHMAYIKHPIVGDASYGARMQPTRGMTPELMQMMREYKRQALHAFSLGLIHPETEEFMQWEVDLPPDMVKLIELLKEDSLLAKK